MADQKNDDDVLGKAYDSTLMKRLLAFIMPYKQYVILAIVLNVLVAALGPLRPYLTKIAIDEYIAKSDYHGLLLIGIALIGTLIIQSVMQYLLTYYTQYLGQKTILDLRTKLFRHVQTLAVKYFDKTPIGRTVTRVTNDIETLNEMFSSGIIMIFSDIFIIIWIFGFMFAIDWKLSLVTLSVMPFLIYGTFLFRKKAREAYRDVRLYVARLNSYMQEHVSGISITQSFNKQDIELSTFSDINRDHRDANVRSVFYYAIFFPAVEFLTYAAIALIIWYGGGQVIQQQITLGVLLAFIQYTEMFFRPIRDLSEKYNILQTAMASSERIFTLFDETTIIKNPENPKPLKVVEGKIDFKNVWFAYNNDEYVLKNVNLSINPGETVAIVGHTGAGKSSMINILTRFYDINKGEILVDGINITEVDKRELRRHISLVLQDVFLFHGTIRSNITMGSNAISDEQMIKAAELVGADKFIRTLPNGYNEEVKERGSTLSVGQKQLISFARALANNPRILILDEATSSVDTETEFLIQEAIQKLLKNRTSIVIAHRLSTIQNANKIVVMHKGEIKEVGNHQELLAKKGIYYKLYQLQYKDQELPVQ